MKNFILVLGIIGCFSFLACSEEHPTESSSEGFVPPVLHDMGKAASLEEKFENLESLLQAIDKEVETSEKLVEASNQLIEDLGVLKMESNKGFQQMPSWNSEDQKILQFYWSFALFGYFASGFGLAFVLMFFLYPVLREASEKDRGSRKITPLRYSRRQSRLSRNGGANR